MSTEISGSNDFLKVVESLSLIAPAIEDALSRIPPDKIMSRYGAGEWSLGEHICHLRDIEVEGYMVRIRRILNEDRPSLADINGDQIAAERNYRENCDARSAFESLKTARTGNLELLRSLSDQNLSREGLLEGVGAVSLKSLAEVMQTHDREHLTAIAKLVNEFGKG